MDGDDATPKLKACKPACNKVLAGTKVFKDFKVLKDLKVLKNLKVGALQFGVASLVGVSRKQ
jgi:hypothetical protein